MKYHVHHKCCLFILFYCALQFDKTPISIYRQVESQIINNIVTGHLLGGDMLPSIRALARDLQISVITIKRAYEELEKKNYIETVPGKGSFVANINSNLLKEKQLEKISEKLDNIIIECHRYGITKNDLQGIVDILWED